MCASSRPAAGTDVQHELLHLRQYAELHYELIVYSSEPRLHSTYSPRTVSNLSNRMRGGCCGHSGSRSPAGSCARWSRSTKRTTSTDPCPLPARRRGGLDPKV